jgi:hypothetical protein
MVPDERGDATLEKLYYDATSLERLLLWFEARYGMATVDFYGRHGAGDDLPGIPRFHRHIWASFHRDVLRLRDDFASNAERVLALV